MNSSFRACTLLAFCLLNGLRGAAEPPRLRLPEGVTPLQGTLDLTVQPAKGTVAGTVDLEIRIKEPTSQLWLNATKLKVGRVTFTPAGGKAVLAQARPEGDDFLGLTFAGPVTGQGHLLLTYAGAFGPNDEEGLFARKDGDATYAYTQFESLGARKAFPCFDEPGFKVPWQVTLHVAEGNVAFANTPLLSKGKEKGGMTAYRFKRTRPLPSYLVAFAVGPFQTVDAGQGGRNHIPLRIIVPRGHTAEAAYAVTAIPRVLAQLEDYFGTPLPSDKLDALAVPQFSGAMENPGLITYNSSLLLARPGEESVQFRRDFMHTAAHEMAHQWFGDLVTMAWWNDLWLNEGFASWMGPRIVDRLEPSWGVKVDRVEDRNQAMGQDSLVSARRIRQPIEGKGDISNAFDGITYRKGAALLAQFEALLGQEAFQRGVRRYLEAHADGNATTGDFLAALAAEGFPGIPAVFATFLDQAGVPVVTAELKAGPGGTSLLRLSQRRFLPLGSPGAADQLWQIPVAIRCSARGQVTHPTLLLAKATAELSLPFPPSDLDYLLVNDGMLGYYRTCYRGDLLERLLQEAATSLAPNEKVGLLAEATAAASLGELSRGQVLALVPRFKDDPDRHVQALLAGIAKGIQADLVPVELRPNYARFVQRMFGDRARNLGLLPAPLETEDTKLLRAALVPLVGDAGEDADLRRLARILALKWLDNRTAVDPSVLGPVLQLAGLEGDKALFDRYLAEAVRTKDNQDLDNLFHALGSFRNPVLMGAALDLTLSEAFDPMLSINILWDATEADATRTQALAFMEAHFDQLASRLSPAYGAGFPLLGRGLCDPAQAKTFQAFFKARLETYPGSARNLAIALESIGLNVAARNAHLASTAAFLKGY